MLIDHVLVRWRVLALVVASLAAGCTKPNPRSCLDGTCTDPAFPFCDVDGALDGQPNTCIAVECTPMEFAGCRGDLAITCNTAGTDFELVQCERGCEEGTGCRLCDPNETACTNGTVATCDAAGTVVSSQPCPLGCFEDEPRCRDIDPSNDLGRIADMVPSPPDFSAVDAAIETDTGTVRIGAITATLPSFLVPAPSGGTAIRVFVVNNLELDGATVYASGDPRNAPGPALAFLARGEVTLRGEIVLDPRVGSAVAGCLAPGKGLEFQDQDGRGVTSGGGGGGNATTGASGGAINGIVSPVGAAAAGGPSGTAELVPLRGGCSGGFIFSSAGTYPTGGGALQISSAARITVAGTLDVRGLQGALEGTQVGNTGLSIQGGGGAGGGLLLEAPEVQLGASAKLLASGGAGALGCGAVTANCSAGGDGATGMTPARAGVSITAPSPGPVMSGGGGGGLGRIRINTPTQSFTAESTAVTDGALTTGALTTR